MRLMQEWLNRPRDADFRFRARLRPQLALWLVWWLVSHALRDRQWWINYESFVAVCIDIKTQVSRRNPVFLSITFSSFQFLRIIIMIILRL